MKHARPIAGIVLGAMALAGLILLGTSSLAPWATKVPGISTQSPAASAPANYVGASTCSGCHAAEAKAWKGSHHQLAMQHANEKTVLANFDNARFVYNGVTTTFTTRDGRFFVNTDGPDGKLADYEVRYTFGVAPLQQYLLEFPGGRMQALGIAWDSRSSERGGQRWFHLYPNEKVDHKDELHWTRLSQNWNHMCAECHSTEVRKNYDVAADKFNTTWSEINVACESCHGPGSRHVAWARKSPGAEQFDLKGLVFLLDERQGANWAFNPGAKTATRTPPRTTSVEMDTCARCHSRRSMLTDDYQHGRPIMDSHLPSLLTEPLYHPDGQIKEEDFEYGSFLQSKMFQQGVTCSDCHEPHSLKLRAPGNQTCLQCHEAKTYDSKQHHFHSPQGKGTVCADCHMPTTNFMVVHPRHDHSIRIPRPDLSLKLQTPNACSNCHAREGAAWAVAQMNTWYGSGWSQKPHFGTTFAAAQQGGPVGPELAALAAAPGIADIARATAATLLPNYLDPSAVELLPRLLSDGSPLVRRAALASVEAAPPEERLRLAGKLLADPVLAVRIEAARVLSVLPRQSLTAEQGQALVRALEEYIRAAQANAEHPQSHVNLGLLYLGLGQVDQAERSYLHAIKLDPAYAIAYVNLADLYRQRQADGKAETTLMAARAAIGDNAAVEHALGLHFVRSKQMPQALSALAMAARLQPGNARYGYVYAVGLHSSGESARAITTLRAVHARHPNDRDVLVALASYSQSTGDARSARSYAQKLVDLDPRYGSVEQILQQIAQ